MKKNFTKSFSQSLLQSPGLTFLQSFLMVILILGFTSRGFAQPAGYTFRLQGNSNFESPYVLSNNNPAPGILRVQVIASSTANEYVIESDDYANKWTNTSTPKNVVTTFTWGGGSFNGPNGSLTGGFIQNKHYTLQIRGLAYSNCQGVIIQTDEGQIKFDEASPVVGPANVCTGTDASITINLASAKSSQEKVFVRYSSTSNFGSSKVVEATGVGSNWSTATAVIPGSDNTSGTIFYYAYTTTVAANNSTDHDLVTLEFGNNGGSNYNYLINAFPEGCIVTRTWYIDRDQDGHGSSSVTLSAVNKPNGYVIAGNDCNDRDANTYPGATELCDGKDNDCDGTIDDGLAQITWYRDQDGDGYGKTSWTRVQCSKPGGFVAASGDCDDLNSAVNPDATEVCSNGIDDDCDGIKDEGCAVLWYRDADKDGRGNPNVSVLAAVKPAGYVINNNDCRDNDRTVYLNAPELCDGKDNDCDGTIDEGFAVSTWYRDQDGDQFGKTSWKKVQCTQPAGFVAASGDCNDTDPTIYPGALEICDGKDNDCVAGGRDLGCPIAAENLITTLAGKPVVDAETVSPEVTLYPNPARDEIVVTINGFEAGKKVEMQLMQADGKVQTAQSIMPTVKGQQVRMDVSRSAAGLYLLQVKQGLVSETKRVMIIR